MDTGKRSPRAVGSQRFAPATIARIGLAILLAAVAAWAMPRAIQAGDAGELATVMLRGGIPHPSGYPWMRVLGPVARAFEYLGLSPALAAALPCALAGIGAWLVLHRVATAWGLPVAGALTLAVVATSGVVVAHVNDSEVWGLHLLFCAAFVYTAFVTRRSPLVLGLALGLAVSHHLTAVLLVPLAIGAAWPTPGRPAAVLRAGLLGVAGSVLGLLAFGTLALGDGGAWRWGDTRSLAGLWHHVSRADYGTTQLSLHTQSVSIVDLWSRALSSIGGALTAELAAHALLGLLVLTAILVFARRPDAVPRETWLGLWISIAATTLLFPALLNIDPSLPFGAWILERFDLLPIMLWSLPAMTVVERLRPRLEGRRLILVLAPAALLLGQLTRTWTRGVPSEDAGVQAYAMDLLETPPADAIVFGTDDHRTFPVLFAAQVLETRPDVLYLDASLLYHPWYRARAQAQRPGLPIADKPLNTMALLWEDAAWHDTPVYLANVFSRPAATELQLIPEGILLRVVPPHADPADFAPDEVTRRHLEALTRYRARRDDFAGLHSPDGHPWSADLWHPYVEHTRQLAQAMRAGGREDLAAKLDAAARELEPG